jgi:hypothetical protein
MKLPSQALDGGRQSSSKQTSNTAALHQNDQSSAANDALRIQAETPPWGWVCCKCNRCNYVGAHRAVATTRCPTPNCGLYRWDPAGGSHRCTVCWDVKISKDLNVLLAISEATTGEEGWYHTTTCHAHHQNRQVNAATICTCANTVGVHVTYTRRITN